MLSIPDQISIDIGCREAIGQPPQKTSEVDDFPMGSTHRSQAMTIGQKLRHSWIDCAFIFAFMFDNLPADNAIGFEN